METPSVLVTGATGNQGGAVMRQLLKAGFHVIAMTRDATSPKATALKSLGAELLQADLNQVESYEHVLREVEGVFSVQTFENGVEKELNQGLTLADRCKSNGVKHLVYSSTLSSDLKTGIPHFDTKFAIEEHIRHLGISYTILRPGSLYENFLIPQVRSRIVKGKLTSPIHANRPQPMIACEDIGKLATAIFQNPETYRGQTVEVVSEVLTLEQAAKIFSDVLKKKITYGHLPMPLARLFMGRTLHKMFKWVNDNPQIVGSNSVPAVPNPIRLAEWIETSFIGPNSPASRA